MFEGDSGVSKDATDPLVGKVLNERFSIVEVIGTGGMGRVYKAIQAPLDRVVALKVLNPHYGADGRDPNFQKRFFLEASLTSKLRSPHTITVHDYGRTEDGIYYIAMEYVEGRTLAQVLSTEGPLPWQRALLVAQQICRSLREAHKNGIVHRDLKPANVMLLSEDEQVKVLDFGLVKSMGTDDAEITQAGMMLGSPLYMAPEQAKRISDARSDIYSLGVVLYQMVMGRPPFVAKESVDAIVKHISSPVPRFGQVRPDLAVPAEIEAVVLKCLEKSPDQRFQSMDELLEAMRAAASASGVSGLFNDLRVVSPATSPLVSGSRPVSDSGALATRAERSPPAADEIRIDVEPPRSGRSRTLLFAGVFAASLLAGGAVVFFATRGTSPSLPPAPVATAVPPTEVAPPPEAPTPEPRPEPQPPPPAPVRFHVTSEPAGAKVRSGDRELGVTPLDFEVTPAAGRDADAKLTFSLDGYESSTLSAGGPGPVVEVHQRLHRRSSRKPARGKRTGYKDDPYQ